MIEVEIERSVRRQNTMHLNQAKFQEAQILFERKIITVFNRRDHFEWIGPTSEATTGPVTPTGFNGIQALPSSGPEWWIRVDEVDRTIWEAA